MKVVSLTGGAILILAIARLAVGGETVTTNPVPQAAIPQTATKALAMFGAGCFWCSEAVFQRIPGVLAVQSGYAGGHVKNPTYEQVCSGDTGHAEVTRVTYDPRRVSYEQLLDAFWAMHDPTTLNRQGADVGPQYRSVIFTFSAEQRAAAIKSRERLNASGHWSTPLVTEIADAPEFYPAETYHADYFNRNRSVPYCRFVIAPKLKKLGMEP